MTASIPSLKFAVRDIQEKAGLAAHLSIPAADCMEFAAVPSAALAGPVSVQIEFSVGGNRILLQARFQGAWKTACSRCLTEHPAEFSSELDETYELGAETIDLSEDLRQTLLLEIPQRSLCSPACKGLCPRCGKNLNEGPCGCLPKPASAFETLKKLIE